MCEAVLFEVKDAVNHRNSMKIIMKMHIWADVGVFFNKFSTIDNLDILIVLADPGQIIGVYKFHITYHCKVFSKYLHHLPPTTLIVE